MRLVHHNVHMLINILGIMSVHAHAFIIVNDWLHVVAIIPLILPL